MSLLCVVLDANVLFPASLRDILLRLADIDLYRLYITDEILEETCRNLVRTGRMSDGGATHFKNTIKTKLARNFVDEYHHLIPLMTNDVKDRHVLASAVKCEANVIVTNNVKDFPITSLSSFGIYIQSPDEILIHFYRLNSKVVINCLTEQANDLRNPAKTLPELLDTLAQHTPKFIELVRMHFSSLSNSSFL